MRRGKAALSALVAASSVLGLMAVGSAGARVESAAAAKDVYIVQMIDPPAVAYEGGIAGLNATKPAKGEKIDPGTTRRSRMLAAATSSTTSITHTTALPRA